MAAHSRGTSPPGCARVGHAQETPRLLLALDTVASKTHEFISDVTSFDSTELYSSAEELADALRTASAHLRATAAALSPPAAQQVRRPRGSNAVATAPQLLTHDGRGVARTDPAQELLGASIDVLDKYLLLLQAARQQVTNTRDADARVRTRNLADTVATAVAALRCVAG